MRAHARPVNTPPRWHRRTWRPTRCSPGRCRSPRHPAELLDTARCSCTSHCPRRRVGIVSNGGGPESCVGSPAKGRPRGSRPLRRDAGGARLVRLRGRVDHEPGGPDCLGDRCTTSAALPPCSRIRTSTRCSDLRPPLVTTPMTSRERSSRRGDAVTSRSSPLLTRANARRSSSPPTRTGDHPLVHVSPRPPRRLSRPRPRRWRRGPKASCRTSPASTGARPALVTTALEHDEEVWLAPEIATDLCRAFGSLGPSAPCPILPRRGRRGPGLGFPSRSRRSRAIVHKTDVARRLGLSDGRRRRARSPRCRPRSVPISGRHRPADGAVRHRDDRRRHQDPSSDGSLFGMGGVGAELVRDNGVAASCPLTTSTRPSSSARCARRRCFRVPRRLHPLTSRV